MENVKRMYAKENGSIVIENRHFALTVNKNAVCESLILKENGRELLEAGVETPIFSLTEKRP